MLHGGLKRTVHTSSSGLVRIGRWTGVLGMSRVCGLLWVIIFVRVCYITG